MGYIANSFFVCLSLWGGGSPLWCLHFRELVYWKVLIVKPFPFIIHFFFLFFEGGGGRGVVYFYFRGL